MSNFQRVLYLFPLALGFNFLGAFLLGLVFLHHSIERDAIWIIVWSGVVTWFLVGVFGDKNEAAR